MQRLLTFPASPKGKWVVLAVWLVAILGSSGAGLASRFSDAEENSSTAFLSSAAESTAALEVTERLAGAKTAPTLIVYRRDGGLTAADRAAIEADLAELNRVTQAFANTLPFGHPEGPAAPEPFEVSRDGTTALIGNVIRSTGSGDSSEIVDPVTRYRDVVRDGAPDGLDVRVTGPAGLSADAIAVFRGINGTLIGAAFLLVVLLLVLIYRSPVFWCFPILAVGVADAAARAFGWGLTELGVTVNGRTSALLSILVIGAGTDYALLLVARYREELHRHEDKHEAMALALRRAGPAILASGLTVMAALLPLSLSKVTGTAGLGPIGAMGIGAAVLAMLTFLPALLTIVGRRPFYPFVPHGPAGRPAPGFLVRRAGLLNRLEERLHAREGTADERHGPWRRLGERIAVRPRLVGGVGLAALVVMALGLLNFSAGLTQSNAFRESVESVEGLDLVGEAFASGRASPTDIVLPASARAGVVVPVEMIPEVVKAARGVEGVSEVPPRPVDVGESGFRLAAYLGFDPYSTQAFETVPRLREAVREVAPGALVGGSTAIEYDLRQASGDDTRLLIPLALLVVLVILVGVLRAVVLPVLLVSTVVLSFLAALGVGAVVFDVIFGFPGSDPGLPLIAFIFLVALGVDYTIFLMTRVREETLMHGTRDGMLRGLAVTGGVITSAGIVLAGTFAVLGVLPLIFLTEIGFVIAFGVLLDTFIVRSIIVPALVLDLGPKVWWPSKLASPDGRD